MIRVDNMGEVVKLQKSGENLVITIPIAICENLDLKEGDEVEMEPFTCGGETGARIRPKK
jgi:antitoxin component of MazEF toxin-antitoxin module